MKNWLDKYKKVELSKAQKGLFIPGVTDFKMQRPVSESTSAGAIDRRMSANYAAQKGNEVENFIRDYQKKYPGMSREKAMNAFNMSKQAVQNQGQIKKAAPKRSKASKALAIAINPMTALQYKVKGQDIPENFDRGERNSLDMAVDVINPFSYAQAAKDVGSGFNDGNYAQAGLGLLNFIPGKFFGKAASKLDDLAGIKPKSVDKVYSSGRTAFKPVGPRNYTPEELRNIEHISQLTPEQLNQHYASIERRLQDIRDKGKYWDEIGAKGSELLNDDMIYYHGTYDGRPLVEVKMPDETSQYFYKSTGWAGKKGAGAAGTTDDMWQVYGEHNLNFQPEYITKNGVKIKNPDAGKPTKDWFIKGPDYDSWYGSNTFRDMSGGLDFALAKKYGLTAEELPAFLNQKNISHNVDTYTPGYKRGGMIKAQNGFTYQMPRASSESTRIPQRDYELERQVRLRNTMAAQPQLRQARPNTPAQEKERIRKNRVYASQQPNARIDEQGNVSRINPNRSVTGKAENFMSRREDKAAEHIMGALDAAGAVTGVGELASLGARAVKPILARSMESGLLSKAHKLNPWALTERKIVPEGTVARQIFGDEAFQNFQKYGPTTQPGVSESKQLVEFARAPRSKVLLPSGETVDVISSMKGKDYAYPYFSEGQLWYNPKQTKHFSGKERIITAPSSEVFFPAGEGSVLMGEPSAQAIQQMAGRRRVLMPGTEYADPSKYKVYERDWLRGYKEVPQQKEGGIIEDNRGQWAHPGKPTRISSSNITMEGVPYPVLAKANNGQSMMMYPGQDYYFPGADYVDEYPIMQRYGGLTKAQSGLYIPPTASDSLNLYNRALAIKNYYDSKGYKKAPAVPSPQEVRKEYEKTTRNILNEKSTNKKQKNELVKSNKTFFDVELKDAEEYEKNLKEKKFPGYLNKLEETRKRFRNIGGPDVYVNKDGKIYDREEGSYKPFNNKDFYNPIDKNQFEQRELSFGFLDTQSPMPLYDRRIVPQNYYSYRSPDTADYTDNVELYEYDPLAIKPYELRTPEEKVEWENLYGKNKTPKQVESKPKLEEIASVTAPQVKPKSEKTQFAFTYTPGGGNKQETIYYPTYEEWRQSVDKANAAKPGYNPGMVQTTVKGDRSSAEALLQGTPQFYGGGKVLPKAQYGLRKKYLPEKVQNWVEPNYVAGKNPDGNYGYSEGTVWYDPNSEVENINNPWWAGHEKYHHYQAISGRDTKERRDNELNAELDKMIKSNPQLQFVPRSKLISGSKSFPGAEARMYDDPSTLEGEARLYEEYIERGGKPIFPNKKKGGLVKAQDGLNASLEELGIVDPNKERYALGMIPNTPASGETFEKGTTDANEFLRNWYSGRVNDPRYGNVAKQRLDMLSKIPIKPADPEFLKKKGWAAYHDPRTSAVYIDANDPYSRAPGTQVHELHHALYYEAPQEDQDQIIMPFRIGKKQWKKENPELAKKPTAWGDIGRPTEIASRLSEFRRRYGIDPSKKYTGEEMKKIMDAHKSRYSSGFTTDQKMSDAMSGDRNIDQLFNIIGNDPAKLAELNDEIVMNQRGMTNAARYGGDISIPNLKEPVSLYKNGGSWLNKYK